MLPDKERVQLHQVVGYAIDEYSQVELLLSTILAQLLKCDSNQASIVFRATQNVRARGVMFSSLISIFSGGEIDEHWNECNGFLNKLADFRNVIAHWTFAVAIYINREDVGGGMQVLPSLTSPTSQVSKPIHANDINKFLKDCFHAKAFLNELNSIISDWPASSPEISRLRPIRQNLAVLPQPQTAKAPQPQRPPSKESPLVKAWKKPSAKQKRQRALSALKKK
ncbi:MAG: hypothetical protein ACOY4O_17855 [Pseudomonadota bacterium]